MPVNLECKIDGGVGNLGAGRGRRPAAWAGQSEPRDPDVRALGAFQRLGDLVGRPAIGGFAVDRSDLIAGVNAGAIVGRVLIGSDHVDLALAVVIVRCPAQACRATA